MNPLDALPAASDQSHVPHLDLREITDGPALAADVAAYQRIYNHERPHECRRSAGFVNACPAKRGSASP